MPSQGGWSSRGPQVCGTEGPEDQLQCVCVCVCTEWVAEHKVVGSTECLYAETDFNKVAFQKAHSGSEVETKLEVGKCRGRKTSSKPP